MFFKSRMQRDIDDFRAMQDRGRRAQSYGHSDQADAATSDVRAVEGARRREENAGNEVVGEPAFGSDQRNQTVVSANANWEGRLTTEGSAWLEGQMSGEVEAGETVFIARGAKVRANIHARRAIVGGDMEGQITCREQLVVECSGRLGGKVTTKTLVIEDGAVVHSEIEMLRDDGAAERRARDTRSASRRDPIAIGPAPQNQRGNAGQPRQLGSKTEHERKA